jgi:hypothetical protein
MLREDFVMRMIRQLAEVIARIAGFTREGKHDDAAAALEEAYRSHLGMPKSMVDRLDAETVARTLGAEKSMIVAALLDAEATMHGADVAARAARANQIRTAAGLPAK